MASCEYFIQLISGGLDGQLTEEQERELAEHLVSCPACREIGVQLVAAHAAFAGMEELEAPQGFAQGVMDRIRRDEDRKPKVVPLFRRPQVRALGGLAACAALCVGLMSGVFSGRGGSAALEAMVNESSAVAYYAADSAPAEAPAAMAPALTEAAAAYGMEKESVEERQIASKTAEMDAQTWGEDLQTGGVVYSTVLDWSEELTAPRAVVVSEPEDLTGLLQDGGTQAVILESWEEVYHKLDSGSYVAVVLTEPSGSITHEVMEVDQDRVVIRRWAPEEGTDDMTASLRIIWTEEVLPAGKELKVVLVEE